MLSTRKLHKFIFSLHIKSCFGSFNLFYKIYIYLISNLNKQKGHYQNSENNQIITV